MRALIFFVAMLLCGYLDAACNEYELSKRVLQFNLPFSDGPLVTEAWFSDDAKSKLYMWNSEIFYKSKVDFLVSRKGIKSFSIKSRIKKSDAFTKILLIYGDGSKSSIEQKWACMKDEWIVGV